MAKKEVKAIEVSLYDVANKLRESITTSQNKHLVLSLIFLKFASDKFEKHPQKLNAEGKEKYIAPNL